MNGTSQYHHYRFSLEKHSLSRFFSEKKYFLIYTSGFFFSIKKHSLLVDKQFYPTNKQRFSINCIFHRKNTVYRSINRAMQHKWVHTLMRAGSRDKTFFFFLGKSGILFFRTKFFSPTPCLTLDLVSAERNGYLQNDNTLPFDFHLRLQ